MVHKLSMKMIKESFQVRWEARLSSRWQNQLAWVALSTPESKEVLEKYVKFSILKIYAQVQNQQRAIFRCQEQRESP